MPFVKIAILASVVLGNTSVPRYTSQQIGDLCKKNNAQQCIVKTNYTSKPGQTPVKFDLELWGYSKGK